MDSPIPTFSRIESCPKFTQILSRIELGDPAAADELLPLVYDELRKLAAAKLAQQTWDHRGHFFAATAELVKIRLFAGLSVEQAGAVLGLSCATAYRHWTCARAWL